MVLTRFVGAALAGAWLAAGAGAVAAQSTGSASTRSASAYASPSRYRAGDEVSGATQQQVRTGWIGIGLSCTDCRLNSSGKTVARWVFTAPPSIYFLDPDGPADRAGLRRGDTLLTIDGMPFVSSEGGEAFANLRPGVRIRLRYLRDGRERTANVTPVVSPTLRQLASRDSDVVREYTRRGSEEAARAQREAAQAQRDLAWAQEELSRVARSRDKRLTDSSLAVIRRSLSGAARALRPSQPYAVWPPVAAPAPPAPNVAAPAPPAPTPVTPWTFSGTPRLRYSGRLGNVSVEARRPGSVNVVESGDSSVVLSGGDLTVRIALEGERGWRGVSTSGSTIRTSSGDVAYGITGYLVNPRLGQALGVRGGVLVLSVEPASHADSLGIEPGDVVVELNDQPAVAILPSRSTGRGQAGAATAVVVRDRERRALSLPAATSRTRPRGTPTPRPPRPASPAPTPRPTTRGVPPVPVDTI